MSNGPLRGIMQIMRRVVSFLLAFALMFVGMLVLLIGPGWHGILIFVGCSMLGLGAYWFWVDFINPTREEER